MTIVNFEVANFDLLSVDEDKELLTGVPTIDLKEVKVELHLVCTIGNDKRLL